MSALSSLARLQAVAAGIAQPVATVRHCHVSDAPLVLVPLKLSGEAAAPLAVLAGSAPDDPTLLVVPQPRNRDLRFAFAASLAKLVLNHIETSRGAVESCRPARTARRGSGTGTRRSCSCRTGAVSRSCG